MDYDKSGMDITSMTVSETSALLSSGCGRTITKETIKSHAVKGDLISAAGRMSLIDYCAWLLREGKSIGP